MRRAPARPVRACFARQRCTVPKVPLETPHSTLHSSHCHSSHFTLRTYTSHSTLHLFSSELFSPHLSSSHLISSHLFLICHLSSTAQPEHCSTFLISSKLLSTHLSSSACHKAFAARDKSLAHKNECAEKLLHTEAWDTDAFTQKSLYTKKASAHEKRLHTARF